MKHMRIFIDEISTPLWLTIVLALASGVLATIITLIVQFVAEKKRVEKDLFLKLVSLRDCFLTDETFKNTVNMIQIVFYSYDEVVTNYEKFVSSMNEDTFCEGQTVLIDEFIALLESMAKVTGYKNFDWKNIKKKFATPSLRKETIEEHKQPSITSKGLKTKTKTKNNSPVSNKQEYNDGK